MELTLHTAGRRAQSDGGAAIEQTGTGLRAEFTLREGQTGGVMLESMCGPPRALPPEEIPRLAEHTGQFWRSWLGSSTYTGRWREMVSRSAITLKLLTYAPTRAPVAAAPFRLPQHASRAGHSGQHSPQAPDCTPSLHAL